MKNNFHITHPLYNTFSVIKQRCYNPKDKDYPTYEGRGIHVCPEWLDDRKSFIDWALDNGWEEGLQIDRIENHKGYSPDNCRWVTIKEQANNKRNNHTLTFNGQTLNITQWSEITGIHKRLITYRIFAGWGVERALTQPVQKYPKNKGDNNARLCN